jgi:2',3'-cyclic-nucleotide 2'-phosphodiesterase (5'-nucleotidase family)
MRCCISAAVIAVMLLVAACGKPASPPPPLKARLYVSCDVSGRIEPCGCFTGQLGGLTRLKTLLDGDAEPSLRVDVGGALAGTQDYEVMQYRHVLRAFGALGYHATNAGSREAALDAATLAACAKDSPVPILSANLLDAKTHLPVLRPWLHAEVGGVRYGVIGIVDSASISEGGLGNGLEVADAASTIRALLPEVRRVADVVVLLAFATEKRMQALAAQFFEIHVILGGDVSQPSQELVQANRSLILATANQGRAIGFIESPLTEGKLVRPRHAIRMLYEQVPQDKNIIDVAKNYRAEVRAAALRVDDPGRVGANDVPGVRQPAAYVGSESCAACHAADYAIWKNSGHARAWQSLVRRESDADPACISCHSVGFGTESGYRRAFHGSKLVDVGCESCHGPGSRHVVDRASGTGSLSHFRPLGAGDCIECHHGEFSRPFDYAEFWKHIKHGSKAGQASEP